MSPVGQKSNSYQQQIADPDQSGHGTQVGEFKHTHGSEAVPNAYGVDKKVGRSSNQAARTAEDGGEGERHQ